MLQEPIKIMFVIGTLQIGGGEGHLARVAPALVARGWHVSVFSLGGDGPLRETLTRAGVQVIAWPFFRVGRPRLAKE